MKALWRHMTGLWPRMTLLPALPFVLWTLYCVSRGELRWELIAVAILVPALAYGSERTKRLYLALLPLGLVGLLYDAMRFVRHVGITAERVHVCDLRALEMSVFGLNVGGARMTVQDWLQQHWHPALDALFAIPYGTYIFIPVAYALYLFIGRGERSGPFLWTFFALNVCGFAIYHLYPAAPPWYFHQHGCAVDLNVHAYEGANLARIDARLGFRWFAGLYGRAYDIFGAMPSLHIAYPLLIVLDGWSRHRALGRTLSVMLFVTMCCAAVYLDHHWILDIAAGAALTVVVYALVRRAHAAFTSAAASSTTFATRPRCLQRRAITP